VVDVVCCGVEEDEVVSGVRSESFRQLAGLLLELRNMTLVKSRRRQERSGGQLSPASMVPACVRYFDAANITTNDTWIR
jgi:hypothetical protein